MEPKYSIGEVVVLHSIRNPHCHGVETIVTAIEYHDGDLFGKRGKYKGFKYQCTVLPLPAQWWVESALRKKHKPGESFTKLIADLKNPSRIWEPV